MSQKVQPKYRFSKRLENGDYLSLAIWPGKAKPEDEILNIQIRRNEGPEWKTVGRLAVYRSVEGAYSQLPEQTIPNKDRGRIEG